MADDSTHRARRTSGPRAFIRRRRVPLALAGLVGVGVLAWLLFGFFGVQALFIDDTVEEAAPVFSSGAGTSEPPGSETTEATDDTAEGLGAPDEGTPAIEDTIEEPPPSETPEVVTLVQGTFLDRSHPTSGRAFVLNDGTEQRFLRFEDFETDNGPDLNVYLSAAAPDAPADQLDDDVVDLGDLKGNVGPQNYELPADVDLDHYRTVVIWCVRFSVAFGAAELQAGS